MHSLASASHMLHACSQGWCHLPQTQVGSQMGIKSYWEVVRGGNILRQLGPMRTAHSIHEWQKTLVEATLVHEWFVICPDEITLGIKGKCLQIYRVI